MKTVQGLWDTGATSSCVSNEVANDLGLIVRGSAEVQHAGGSSLLNTYIVNILLPNNVGFSGVPVMEADIHRQGFDMIIGMDIITQGDFALTNKDGHSRFSFRTPSTETIDYVKQHDQSIVSNLGRNDPCFCGSGKKFKDCHLWELEKRISGL
ncbi:MAG: SEC-C metal-binding domain-containing protein [Coriobacteriia bacterium]|nr:SEC-C metal-binding domain-containing protein [Coriobacteriia bacterium]